MVIDNTSIIHTRTRAHTHAHTQRERETERETYTYTHAQLCGYLVKYPESKFANNYTTSLSLTTIIMVPGSFVGITGSGIWQILYSNRS